MLLQTLVSGLFFANVKLELFFFLRKLFQPSQISLIVSDLVAEQIRVPTTQSSNVSVQHSVGLSPSRDTSHLYCVMHVKEPTDLIHKRKGLPQGSWFDWLHSTLKTIKWCFVKELDSYFKLHNTLQENTEC